MSRIVPVVVAVLAVFTGIVPVYSAEKNVSVEGRGEETANTAKTCKFKRKEYEKKTKVN